MCYIYYNLKPGFFTKKIEVWKQEHMKQKNQMRC
jgi:hypothetical protein